MYRIHSFNHFQAQPLEYLDNLINYGGKKSMVSHLKKLGYVHEIQAAYSLYECWAIFEVEFVLTDKGFTYYEFVIKTFYIWLRYIRNVYNSAGIWKSIQEITENDFYYIKDSLLDASELASSLQRYPFRYINTRGQVIFNKDNRVMNYIFSQMNMDQMITILSSAEFSNAGSPMHTNMTMAHEHYGFEYTILPISKDKKESLQNPIISEGKLINEKTLDSIAIIDLEIPSKNHYMPSKLEMVCIECSIFGRLLPGSKND